MRRAALMLVVWLGAWPGLARPDSSGSQSGKDNASTVTPVPVKLGESYTQLTGPWKFHTGDDMAWAQPDFDDSKWDTMDLTPRRGAEAAGWTKRGYPGYSGYAWYRLRVDVQGANHGLSLKMPDQADDAYQVYVNGQLVGEFGRFTES